MTQAAATSGLMQDSSRVDGTFYSASGKGQHKRMAILHFTHDKQMFKFQNEKKIFTNQYPQRGGTKSVLGTCPFCCPILICL